MDFGQLKTERLDCLDTNGNHDSPLWGIPLSSPMQI